MKQSPPSILLLILSGLSSLAAAAGAAAATASSDAGAPAAVASAAIASTGAAAAPAASPAAPGSATFVSQLPRPAALEPAVQFWIRVYTQITTDGGFIHDQHDLSIVYETLHFDADMSARERQHQVDAEKQRFHDILGRLGRGLPPADAEERRVQALWGAATSPARLAVAADDVRFQLGQADRFRAGLIRAGAWQHHIAQVLARLGLPPQLSALPHVESSFDPAAYSKVGAAGLWQFLRSTGRRFLRINASVDERLDPFRETEAAAQLLAYNYRLLGSWPLAITAYNHGAAGMLRAREQLGTDDIVRIVRDYHSPTFGFASRNFYVSFLAALTVAQDPQKYFGNLRESPQIDFHELRMPAAASVVALQNTLGVDRSTLQRLNPALRPAVWRGRRSIPAGYLLRLPAAAAEWTGPLLARRLHTTHPGLVAVAAIPDTADGGAGAGPGEPNTTDTAVAVAPGRGRRAAGGQRATPLALAPTTNMLAASGTLDPSPLLGAPSAAVLRAGAATDELTGDSAPAASPYYLVRPGDTVSSIADRAGIATGRLMALNSLPDQDFLYEGERLRLAASVPEPGVASSPALAALAAQAVQENHDEQQAVALADHMAAAEEPVSAAQAQAEGPQLVPGVAGPPSADPVDYTVAADGSIRVVAAETLGHYADWLDTTAARLRTINHLRGRTPVLMGRRILLAFGPVTPAQFEQRRRDYHEQLQAAYFAMHRITGTSVYVARRGDSLWNITRHSQRVPIWLLQQYNPELNFEDLKPGTAVSLPKVEELDAP